MNTTHLKRFAQEARKKLLTQVGAKLSYVLSTDSAELREKVSAVKQLREELDRTTKPLLIEKVAYTWFNRLMALRFMDINDYQPLGIRVITPKDGYTIPELLDEAKRGNIPDELKVNRQKIYDILDGKTPSNNPQNEAYKELLIASCNHLHTTFPFLFERINDYTELLLPDDLTSNFSIVKDVRDGMPMEDCTNVEIIGWLYQFYISEEKDRLINAKKKYNPHEIAPVTQLFTPKWIVQYMVDNTLGQLWKEARPNTKILSCLEFYIKPDNENIIPPRDLQTPEEIKFFDPCVGSAHILSYAFDVFCRIYEEEGYNQSEIPELIITKNLYGIDIDERAAQLAAFSLMMKGRQYQRRFLRKGIQPNITSFRNSNLHPKFKNAQTIGSLIKINRKELEEIQIEENSIFADEQRHLKKQASFLAQHYDLVVTNPPYLNSSYMEGELKQYVEKEFSSTKSDLFACFLIHASSLTKQDGLIGFISPYVWMFISSYENLRDFIIKKTTLTSLIQLEYNAFEPACVPIATFTLRNGFLDQSQGSYIKLSEFKGHQNQAPKTLEAIRNPHCGWFYIANQKNFEKIPSCPIGYWVSVGIIKIFDNELILKDLSTVLQGMIPGNTDVYLRLWCEVEYERIGFGLSDYRDFGYKKNKWFPYNKGGGFRRWFGNIEHVINMENDGYSIKNDGYNNNYRLRDPEVYFKPALTWSKISSGAFSMRKMGSGHLFDIAGCCAFNINHIDYILAFSNSKVCTTILDVISPTLNYEVAHIKSLPIKFERIDSISLISEMSQILSKEEWNSKENSWDFKKNELIRNKVQDLEETFEFYKQFWKKKFTTLHKNEEELNSQFNGIYGLVDELRHDVNLEDISILQDELDRKALAKLNKKLKRDPKTHLVTNYEEIELPFIASEIMAQFISYAVGCMFGRYSIDKEGLILANQGETINDYEKKILKGRVSTEPIEGGDAVNVIFPKIRFYPDDDNIIPILDDYWFADGIVGRFHEFLKVTFGEKNFNKNLSFIEEQIGKDIRKYFLRDFYADHIKRYKKRPIYWMFSSPKGSFNALIYMHRYTPDTVSNILNKYLKEFIGKLKTRREHLQHVQVTGSPTDKTKAIKEIDGIDKTLVELQEYERDILYPLATERIAIDLDDGVLVNYNKFGKAVKEVTGLNDKKTKDKVRKFDWIDTTQIR